MKSEDKDHHHHHHNRLFNYFHLRMRHEKGAASLKPPKGLMGIRVGIEGAEQQRFMVPVEYLKHPLFVGLLNEAEREFGFDHAGAITIPCRVDYFRHVQGIIDRESSARQTHHHQHHRLAYFAGCFKA